MFATRRTTLGLLAGAGMANLLPRLGHAAPERLLPEPGLAEDGLYTQPWFHESFLEMADDLREAAAEGKDLAVIFEQRGCPYCREMHTVNLRKPEIVDYIKANFLVVQLNLWGAREVTDFDGETLEERALARRWLVSFTPTISFFSRASADVSGKSGNEIEAARMPGYFKPFHFLAMFEFVHEGHYRTTSFQEYIRQRFRRLQAEGRKPSLW